MRRTKVWARQHLVDDEAKKAGMGKDWLMRHSPYSYIIIAGVLTLIILICLYFLYRGPHRRKFPCLPDRRKQPDHRQKKVDQTPTEWRDAQKRSANMLAEMQLEWETERRLKESAENGQRTARKIVKPAHAAALVDLRSASQQSLIGSPVHQARSQPTRTAHNAVYTTSYAPTTSSFGHDPTSSGLAFDLPFPPPVTQAPPMIYTHPYGPTRRLYPGQGDASSLPVHPSPGPLPIHQAYNAQPTHSALHYNGQYSVPCPHARPAMIPPVSLPIPVTHRTVNSRIEYPALPISSRNAPGVHECRPDFSRPRSPDANRQTGFSAVSIYSQATIPMPAPLPIRATPALSVLTSGNSPTVSYYSSGSSSSGSRPRSSSLSAARSSSLSSFTSKSTTSRSSDGRRYSRDYPRKSIFKQTSAQVPPPQPRWKRRSSVISGRTSIRSTGKGHDIAPSPLRQSVSTLG